MKNNKIKIQLSLCSNFMDKIPTDEELKLKYKDYNFFILAISKTDTWTSKRDNNGIWIIAYSKLDKEYSEMFTVPPKEELIELIKNCSEEDVEIDNEIFRYLYI
jgi:hypothetical protein